MDSSTKFNHLFTKHSENIEEEKRNSEFCGECLRDVVTCATNKTNSMTVNAQEKKGHRRRKGGKIEEARIVLYSVKERR